MRNSRLFPVVCVLLSVVFWGVSFISTKVVLRELPPVSIAFFRQLIALVPLILIGIFSKTDFRIRLKDLLLLAASCFFGIVLYFVCENNGLRLTTASSASMIVSAVPIFTMVSEALFFKLRITAKMIFCVILSITGVYLIISVNGRLDFSSSSFLGNLLMIGAMASWVIYTIMSRDLGNRYNSLVITTWQTAASSFLFIPFMVPEIGSWKGVSALALMNLIYLGVFCSAVSYFTFLYAMKKLGQTVSSMFLNLIPVVSVVAGFVILGERLLYIQYTGMAIILFSLFYVNTKRKKGESSLSA